MSPPPDLATLRAAVARHFRVYDAQEDKVRGQVVARRFYIMFPPGEFDARYESLRAELARLDPALLVFLRRDGGEDILFVAERPPDKPQNIPLRVILLVATLATTTIAGAANWHGYWHGSAGLSPDLGATFATLWHEGAFLWGFVSFALPLMLILGIHETAHYVAARRHGLRANLPMFIPAPLVSIGTFGAFISLRDTLPDRKALFDVGVSGPLAGFFATLPIVVVGKALTSANAFTAPDIDRPEAALQLGPEWLEADTSEHGVSNWTLRDPPAGPAVVRIVAHADQGGQWSYALVATFTLANGTQEDRVEGRLEDGHEALYTLDIPAGTSTAEVAVTWSTGLMQFGEPLLVRALQVVWPQSSSEGTVLAHPTYIAGWVGLLITGLNLLPTGQLDGGHVARAVLGEGSRHLARAALFVLVFLAIVFETWILMALFVLLTGIYHPPPLNDRTPLDSKRKAIAWFVLAVFVLTFVPVPFSL